MAAAQTKGHEEDKHTGMQEKKKEKREKKNEKRKVGSKTQKQARKSYSRRLHSNKSSRLCYKAETGTLPHHLPSCSCYRRQRYQVSLLPLSSPPPREQINENQTKLPGLGGCYNSGSTRSVEPVPYHTIYHFICAFVDSSINTAVAPFPPPPSLVITLGVLCSVA